MAAQHHLYFTRPAGPAERIAQVLRGCCQFCVLLMKDEVPEHRMAMSDQPGPTSLLTDRKIALDPILDLRVLTDCRQILGVPASTAGFRFTKLQLLRLREVLPGSLHLPSLLYQRARQH